MKIIKDHEFEDLLIKHLKTHLVCKECGHDHFKIFLPYGSVHSLRSDYRTYIEMYIQCTRSTCNKKFMQRFEIIDQGMEVVDR